MTHQRTTESTFTPGQAAAAAEISPSTLRRYIDKFGEHFTDGVRVKRGKKLTAHDVALVVQIRDAYKNGNNNREIQAELGLIDPPAEDTALSAIPAIAAPLKQLSDQLGAMQARIGYLEHQVEAMRAYQAKTWYQRLFRRPPG